jgi:nicotinamidase/pyrazinamidase
LVRIFRDDGRMNRALIVVDLQRDFCEGGALAASNTLSLLAPLQSFIARARDAGVRIVFTQDWHPLNHSSFAENGGPWPVHCLAGSRGAELMPPVEASPGDLEVRKGQAVDGAGYSGFEGTGLRRKLQELKVESVAVCGVATEYCVRATAMDAKQAGLRVAVLTDLIRSVSSAQGPTLRELAGLGIEPVESQAWL